MDIQATAQLRWSLKMGELFAHCSNLITLFMSWLCGKYRSVIHSQSKRWTGAALDTSPLTLKLEKVRKNYVEPRESTKGILFHTSMVDATRQSVMQTAYFRDRKATSPSV
jgi:hypothetical protein